MKLIHTSDWHIGHVLHNYRREAEFAAMADQIRGIVEAERPDLFLLSGDVFDTASPSNASERFFAETLVMLREACPEMKMIVTAGNHDSATAHEVFRKAWELHGVYTIGRPPRDEEELAGCTVRIPGKCIVAAMPYANAGFRYLGTAELLEYVERENTEGLPVVLMAHTSVSGSDFRGHDERGDGERRVIGNIEAAPLESLGSGYDYCALGHIHHAQTLRGSGGRARYSGSPLGIGFDEASEHSVTVVEISARGERPVVREVALKAPVPLVTIPSDEAGNPDFADWDTALGQLGDFHPSRPTYVRLNVEQTDPLPVDAGQLARRACDSNALFCLVNYRRAVLRDSSRQQLRELSLPEFGSMSPVDVARLYYEDNSLTFGDREAAMFSEAQKQAEEAARNL